jgi:hypothetical protein
MCEASLAALPARPVTFKVSGRRAHDRHGVAHIGGRRAADYASVETSSHLSLRVARSLISVRPLCCCPKRRRFLADTVLDPQRSFDSAGHPQDTVRPKIQCGDERLIPFTTIKISRAGSRPSPALPSMRAYWPPNGF